MKIIIKMRMIMIIIQIQPDDRLSTQPLRGHSSDWRKTYLAIVAIVSIVAIVAMVAIAAIAVIVAIVAFAAILLPLGDNSTNDQRRGKVLI